MGSTSEQRQCAGYDGEGVDGEGVGTGTYTLESCRSIVSCADRMIGTALFPTSDSIHDNILSSDGSTAAGEDRARFDHEI